MLSGFSEAGDVGANPGRGEDEERRPELLGERDRINSVDVQAMGAGFEITRDRPARRLMISDLLHENRPF
jgi:hypothetical protein